MPQTHFVGRESDTLGKGEACPNTAYDTNASVGEHIQSTDAQSLKTLRREVHQQRRCRAEE